MPTVRANAADVEMNLAVNKQINKVPAICNGPGPNVLSKTSLSAIPTIIPVAVSKTRRGRASLLNPSEVIATVTAKSGTACPKR
jgi:hypothetical protein